jgi:serine/threonine protein kinase
MTATATTRIKTRTYGPEGDRVAVYFPKDKDEINTLRSSDKTGVLAYGTDSVVRTLANPRLVEVKTPCTHRHQHIPEPQKAQEITKEAAEYQRDATLRSVWIASKKLPGLAHTLRTYIRDYVSKKTGNPHQNVYQLQKRAWGTLADYRDKYLLSEEGRTKLPGLNTPEGYQKECLRIGHAVATGLVSLHSLQYMHGDLKPANILVYADGSIAVADFGSVVPFPEAGSKHATEFSVTTANYESPEMRHKRPFDHTIDMWGLGCILFGLFYQSPYLVKTPLGEYRHRDDLLRRHTPTDTEADSLPAQVHALISHLLQRDPSKRPQNMAEVCERLRVLYAQACAPTTETAPASGGGGSGSGSALPPMPSMRVAPTPPLLTSVASKALADTAPTDPPPRLPPPPSRKQPREDKEAPERSPRGCEGSHTPARKRPALG